MRKTRLAKLVSLALCLTMALGCFSFSAQAQADKVVIGLVGDPGNIGPFQGMGLGRIGILFTTYEFLVTKTNGAMEGVLMKDYKAVDDLTYQVEIYDYITDQAGNHLTAHDVAWCYQTAKASGNLPKLGSVQSVTAISDYVAEFKFVSLAAGDLNALLMECPIVTRAAYEASPDQMATDPVSTSAYSLVEYASGSKLVYEDKGTYWQKDENLVRLTSKHNIQHIEFDIIVDGAQLTNALKTRSVDVSVFVSDTDIDDFKSMAGFAVSQVPENTTELLVFNCNEGSVFDGKPELRKAIAYAIDSNMLRDGAFAGNGIAVKTYGNTKYADYVEKWNDEEYFEYNPDKAAELFAQTEIPKAPLKLMYITGDSATKMATIIQALLIPYGINVEIHGYDSQLANEYKYQPDQWDILLDEGASSSYLVNVFKLAWDNTGYIHGGAINFVKDAQLQTLLEAALNEETHNDETMDAFHQYLKEQCYGIGLVQKMSNVAHTDTIQALATCFRGQVIPGACEY